MLHLGILDESKCVSSRALAGSKKKVRSRNYSLDESCNNATIIALL
jgi:hypothetical protein